MGEAIVLISLITKQGKRKQAKSKEKKQVTFLG